MMRPMGFPASFLKAFIPLFVAMDPVGLVAVFLALSREVLPEGRRRLVWQATATAAGVTLLFLFLGVSIFSALRITVNDFQVAGGLILLILAGREIIQPAVPTLPQAAEDFGVVPLGMPLIAGPATLTSVIALSQTLGLPATLAALAANLVLVALCLSYGERLRGLLGDTGLRAISKIIALLLAAISVAMIRRGLGLAG